MSFGTLLSSTDQSGFLSFDHDLSQQINICFFLRSYIPCPDFKSHVPLDITGSTEPTGVQFTEILTFGGFDMFSSPLNPRFSLVVQDAPVIKNLFDIALLFEAAELGGSTSEERKISWRRWSFLNGAVMVTMTTMTGIFIIYIYIGFSCCCGCCDYC